MKRILVLATLALAACGPSVKSISVEPAKATLDARGGTAALRAVAKDDKGQPIDPAKVKVTWTSSAPAAATVADAGTPGAATVTAVKSGEATVTAAVGEVKGAAQVVVSIAAAIAVSPEALDLRPGAAGPLLVTVTDDAGKPVTVPRTISWESSDPAVARVVNGKVEALGAGTATVTASTGALKASARVTVRVPEFARLSLTPAKAQTLKKGDKLTLKVAALDRKGAKVAGVPVTWKSSDPRVATVSADGQVSAVKKGSAKITASASGKSAVVGITVQETASKSKAKPASKSKSKSKKTTTTP